MLFLNQEHAFFFKAKYDFFFLIPESNLQSSLQFQTTPTPFPLAISLSPLLLSNFPLKLMCKCPNCTMSL